MLILRRISLTSIAASIGSVWPVVVIECISVVSSLLLSSFFFFFFSCLTRSNCLLRPLLRLLFLLHLSLLLSWYHQVIALRVVFALLFRRLLLLRRVTLNRAVVRVHQSAIVPFVSEREKLVLLLSRVVVSSTQ